MTDPRLDSDLESIISDLRMYSGRVQALSDSRDQWEQIARDRATLLDRHEQLLRRWLSVVARGTPNTSLLRRETQEAIGIPLDPAASTTRQESSHAR